MDYNSNNIDQSLLKAYNETLYSTFNPAYLIKIGQKNEDLSIFLFDNNAYTWAFVSASNPFSIKISSEENQQRHQSLLDFTKNSGLRFLEGEGKHPDSDWSEKSLLILDISKREAIKLARDFEQNAIVFGYFNRAAELVICR
ncbi:MAG: hypothetical protein ACI8P3_000476 [Saprospiraceae bacterium]|jgi:hypothetical protein